MSITGNTGVGFNITENGVTVATGTVTQTHVVPTIVGDLLIESTDIVYSVSGEVGTTPFDFNLNSVNNQSGTGYSTQVIRNNSGDFTNLKSFVIYNSHDTNSLIIGSPSANSLFTWSSTSATLSIPPGGALQFSLPIPLTIGSNGLLKFVGSSSSTTFELYILGA